MTPAVRVRTDQRPLYAQAIEAVKGLAQGGGYAAGDRLPSEIELSQHLGISRPTLREALRLLEEEGVIVRRHGVGTFVAASQPVIVGGLEILESVDRMAERSGLSTAMSEARIEERAATPAELAGLGLAAPAQVTVVTRVITAEPQGGGAGERVAFLTDVVPCKYLCGKDLQTPPPDAEVGFHGSVLDFLLGRGWPLLSHSRTELAAQVADTELARALRIARGAPLLRLEAQLYAQDGPVVDYSISYFVPGYIRFHVVRRVAGV